MYIAIILCIIWSGREVYNITREETPVKRVKFNHLQPKKRSNLLVTSGMSGIVFFFFSHVANNNNYINGIAHYL